MAPLLHGGHDMGLTSPPPDLSLLNLDGGQQVVQKKGTELKAQAYVPLGTFTLPTRPQKPCAQRLGTSLS